MSDKARFIRSVFIAYRAPREKFADALKYAEDAWAFLTAHGYGGPKKDEPKTRERVDWYARLDERQRAGFDRFWRAYNHKHGKAEAAMVWAKIAPDAETLEWICQAARAEAANWASNPPQGQSRIYAQGWLSAFRWQDHPRPGAPEVADESLKARQRTNLFNELQSLKRLHEAAPHPSLQKQIDALEEKLGVQSV